MGSFVLRIKTRVEKSRCKKGKLAACAFMVLRAKSLQLLMRFSEKRSETTSLMLPTLALLTIPVIDLRRASQGQSSVFGTAAILSGGDLEGA